MLQNSMVISAYFVKCSHDVVVMHAIGDRLQYVKQSLYKTRECLKIQSFQSPFLETLDNLPGPETNFMCAIPLIYGFESEI